MPRFPSAQGRLNHEPGFHLSCDENLSEGWGPPLWESQEQFDKFGEVLVPTLQAAGVTATPVVRPVHNLITG